MAAALWVRGRNRADALVLGMVPGGWRNARLPDPEITLSRVGFDEPAVTVRYRRDRNGTFQTTVCRTGDGGNASGKHHVTVHDWSRTGIDLAVDGLRGRARITTVSANELAGRGEVLHVTMAGTTTTLEVVPRFTVSGVEGSTGGLTAPMPGRVLNVGAVVGDRVKAGQSMLVLEAMKMEHHLAAPFDGTVTEVRVVVDDQVDNGAVLLIIEPDDGEAPTGQDDADD